jgi:hypothetical protein
MEKPVHRTAAILALMLAMAALISSVTVADARGGRTTAQDCAAGSDDPDCPDQSDSSSKPSKAP